MTDTIILIDDPNELNSINTKKCNLENSKIFSFNYHAHKKLEEERISHFIAENYLNADERVTAFDLAVSYYDWYKSNHFKDFEIEGVNILGIMDRNELHSLLIHNILKFLYLMKIINKEKPNRIITTTNFSKIIPVLYDKKNISLLNPKNKFSTPLAWDQIDIKFNVGPLPIRIPISRSTYVRFKNYWDSLICTFFRFWYKPNPNKKAILMLEFNPAAYSRLAINLGNYNRDVVFFNNRRSAVWNIQSIKALLKGKGKVLNPNYFLNSKLREKIEIETTKFSQKLNDMWKNESIFTKLFVVNGLSFWNLIKDDFIKTFENRLSEYITLIIISKELLSRANVSCVVCLNQSGETEQAVLKINNAKSPSVLLEHAYANYTTKISNYDTLSGYQTIHDKISVWGDVQKKYLLEQDRISQDKIIVSGSPKHDVFFEHQNNKQLSHQKTILFTPHPINEISGHGDTTMYLKFKEFVVNFCKIVKNIPNVNLIVKLHPGQFAHHEEVKSIFKRIDPSIPIYQIKSTIDLFESCDAVVNVSPESYDPSTVLLEAMIFKKPILNINLDDIKYDFAFLKDEAVLTINNMKDLEKSLHTILFDSSVQEQLIKNSQKHLKCYLSNHGTASIFLAKQLASF